MKTIKALVLVFLFISSNLFSQSNIFKLGFTGAYPNYYNYPVFSTIDWDYYDELKMNTWSGWWAGDTNTHLINTLAARQIGGYFQPDTLRWAGYGRMQINEAEYNASLRFRYNGHRCGVNQQDNSAFGNGQYVRYFDKNSLCNEIEAPAGLVLWDVYENGFQSFSGVPHDPIKQVPFPGDGSPGGNGYINNYYIKPRMRISTEDAFGTLLNVVKIIVKDYNGDTVDEITINTEDFRYNNLSTYDGRYLEDYFTNNMVVGGDAINTGRNVNDPFTYLNNCEVDYQIYWYGEVSFWIDYVKVMDEAAKTIWFNVE